MHPRIGEISSFLQHNDHSLAIRRMLDTCLDTGNASLLREGIAVSKAYHRTPEAEREKEIPQAVTTLANALLERLDAQQHLLREEQVPLLHATSIAKTYSTGHFSLKPTSLSVRTGDIIGIVGQNGNGKTTLLRCLGRQLALDNGTLVFPQLKEPDDYTVRHHVSFIPQRIPRWHGLLKDNLHFSASLSGLKGPTNEVMVDFMLERLDLSRFAHLTWTQISSGYRTRFEIARVLLQRPRLLILDEPLANLDINAQQTILTDLRYLAKSVYNPMGVLLSSQQLHEVEKVADSVLLIKNGECLYRTNEKVESSVQVIELETKASRESLIEALNDAGTELHFNGGFFTLSSATLSAQEMIERLIQQRIEISYFRDITHSTKRYL